MDERKITTKKHAPGAAGGMNLHPSLMETKMVGSETGAAHMPHRAGTIQGTSWAVKA